MAANGYRYNELPENNLLLQNGLITWYDFVTNKTYSARIGNILAGTSDPDDVWIETFEYSEGQIVSYLGKLWIATSEAGNIGQPPSDVSIFWDEEPDPEPGTSGWAKSGTTELTGATTIDANSNPVTIGTPNGPELGVLADQVYLTKGDPNSYGFAIGITDQVFVTGEEVNIQANSGGTGVTISTASVGDISLNSAVSIVINAANELFLQSINDIIIASDSGGVSIQGSTGILINGNSTVDIGGQRVQISGALALASGITPAALTTNTNDYSPTDGDRSAIFRISSTGIVDLTGISVSQINGQEITLINIGANNIELKNDVSSTPANRFLFAFTLLPGMAIKIIYDNVSNRWRKLN
jgi:hypothetical protein